MGARDIRFLVFNTLAGARRFVVAVSAALGMPRMQTDADVTRVGGGRHAPLRREVFYTAPRAIASGRLAGKFVVPVRPRDLAVLDGTTLAIPATYDGNAVPGGAGTYALDLATAEAAGADHDGVEQAP